MNANFHLGVSNHNFCIQHTRTHSTERKRKILDILYSQRPVSIYNWEFSIRKSVCDTHSSFLTINQVYFHYCSLLFGEHI